MREQIVRRPPPAVLLAMADAARGAMTRDRTVAPVSATTATTVAGDPLYLLTRSVGSFLHHRTTVDPMKVERTQRLVVDGPSRLTRNPMYLGLAGLLFSYAITRRNPSTLVPLAGFAWLIDHHQVPAEEETLGGRFGQDCLGYRETVLR